MINPVEIQITYYACDRIKKYSYLLFFFYLKIATCFDYYSSTIIREYIYILYLWQTQLTN